MNFFKNKYFLALAFTAAVFFLSVSLGGEFLHKQVHHHATQKQNDECPVYQLALQLFIAAAVFAFALPLFFKKVISSIRNIYFLSICCAFPSPRSPPVSL